MIASKKFKTNKTIAKSKSNVKTACQKFSKISSMVIVHRKLSGESFPFRNLARAT